MDLGIAGRTALVTAASKGLGRGCAEALAAAGVDLTLNARGAAALEATAEAIRRDHGVKVTTVAADITTPDGRAAVLAAAGPVDILVTNAGGPPPGLWSDWSREDFIRALDANLLTPVALMQALVPGMAEATDSDWTTEYLAPILAVRIVDDLEAACAHIRTYGSGHTEAIVTTDAAAAERFAVRVDSAIVMVNATTQFADGGEFGFGGEIGIATGKFHARGPVGAEQLTSFKYRVRGQGQTRP